MSSLSGSEQRTLHRRSLRVLVFAQVLSGAGLAAGVTVGALLAEDMTGSKGWAGLPAALFTLGSAAAAILVGRLSQRAGRRPGLAAGYSVGALGAAGVVLAASVDSIPLLFTCLFIYGSGVATSLQARYAGADLADPASRGRAISIVLVATTAGAVIGPNLVEATGSVAEGVGTRALAGPFMLAALAYALASAALFALLRPDPLLVARRLADTAPVPDPAAAAATGLVAPPASAWGARQAAVTMIVTQLVMVAVMTMTPIHMRDHGHGLEATGIVISIHIAAMFLPSPLTGLLVDRVGRRPVIGSAAVVLLSAGLLAAAAPTDSTVILALALGLLGFGWNLGLVGGTTLLTDTVPLHSRARVQGSVDLGVALAGATGGMGSGFVVAAAGFGALSIGGAALALAILPLLIAGRSPPTPDHAHRTEPAEAPGAA